LVITSEDVPAGEHPFAIYAWSKNGIRRDEILVPVSSEPRLGDKVLTLLQSAKEDTASEELSSTERSKLGDIHHHQWTEARADHMEQNRQLAAQRIQSLSFSLQARMATLGDQIQKARNPKIHLMKTSEKERAEADHQRRLGELQSLSEQADIRSQMIMYGVLVVEGDA
jgi:hypothetical protein